MLNNDPLNLAGNVVNYNGGSGIVVNGVVMGLSQLINQLQSGSSDMLNEMDSGAGVINGILDKSVLRGDGDPLTTEAIEGASPTGREYFSGFR